MQNAKMQMLKRRYVKVGKIRKLHLYSKAKVSLHSITEVAVAQWLAFWTATQDDRDQISVPSNLFTSVFPGLVE